MDNFLLHAVVAELESKLSGSQSRARIGRMWQYGSSGLLFDLQRRDGKLLAVSVDPNLLGIYLTSSTSRQFGDEPATDTQFIALLKKYLGGGVLRSIEKLGYDRLVRFEFTVETEGGEQVDRQLIVLLTGRAANVLITENDQIIAVLKQRADKSDVFIEPAPPADRIDPFQCSSEKLDQLIADSANDIALAAQNKLIGFSPLYARELAARSSGKSPHAALEELLSEIFEKPHHPRIYSSPSLEILRSKEGLPEFVMILSPIILTHPGDLHEEEFESINDAADAYFKILNSRRKFTAIKQKISSRLTAKVKKVRTLISNLQRERESFKNAEIHQRYGDLLLANLHQAVKTENGFSVTDFFDASQATIEIPSANKPTARDAAEQYFKLARKARHGIEAVYSRLPAAEKDLEQLEGMIRQLASLESIKDLTVHADQTGASQPSIGSSGSSGSSGNNLQVASGRSRNKEVKLTGVRRYKSSDGFEILVGRTDKDNDNLTFRISKSFDLWLHAADYPGSHVVLRNPQRKEIPHRSIAEAAQLAAKFSQAGGGGKVAVNFCERKFVTKMKGFAPGQVRLSSFKTILVEPAEAGERLL